MLASTYQGGFDAFSDEFLISPDCRDEAIARFKETGGAPPDGVKMLGRWHDVSGNNGFTLSEADNAQAIFRWVLEWSDLMTFEVIPVIDDEQFAALLSE